MSVTLLCIARLLAVRQRTLPGNSAQTTAGGTRYRRRSMGRAAPGAGLALSAGDLSVYAALHDLVDLSLFRAGAHCQGGVRRFGRAHAAVRGDRSGGQCADHCGAAVSSPRAWCAGWAWAVRWHYPAGCGGRAGGAGCISGAGRTGQRCRCCAAPATMPSRDRRAKCCLPWSSARSATRPRVSSIRWSIAAATRPVPGCTRVLRRWVWAWARSPSSACRWPWLGRITDLLLGRRQERLREQLDAEEGRAWQQN